MRIISQNRLFDIQYEDHCLYKIYDPSSSKWNIRACSPHLNDDSFWKLGEYDEKDDATAEMDRILLRYSEGWKVYRMSGNRAATTQVTER